MLEFQQFNREWDKKMSDYEIKSEELVEAMKRKTFIRIESFSIQSSTKAIKTKVFERTS